MAYRTLFDTNTQRGSRLAKYLTLAYALPIIYVSLFPFSGWENSDTESFTALFTHWPRYITRSDVILNFVAYAPLGLLVGLAFGRRFGFLGKVTLATLTVVAFSVAMELIQIILPSRSSSSLDLLCNSAGGLLGAIVSASLSAATLTRMSYARDRWFVEGEAGNIGLTLAALWFLLQINPTLPLFGVLLPNQLGVNLGFASVNHVSALELISAVLSLTTVGILLITIARSKRVLWISIASLILLALTVKFVAAALLLRPEAAFQWLSLEVLLAAVLGLVFIYALQKSRWAVMYACGMAILFILLGRLNPNAADPTLTLYMFNKHFSQFLNYVSLSEIAAHVWPIISLVYFVVYGRRLILLQHRVNT
jgi:VanZ family protein